MARRANPTMSFPQVCMFIYIYVCGHSCDYVLYTKLRKLHGLSQKMGVARKRTRTQATDQQKESCVAYVETGTNS